MYVRVRYFPFANHWKSGKRIYSRYIREIKVAKTDFSATVIQANDFSEISLSTINRMISGYLNDISSICHKLFLT